jgi:hypothetical protein
LVYEDDGVSNGYESGEYRLMQVKHNSSGVATSVMISPHREGSGFSGEPTTRAYQLELMVGAGVTTEAVYRCL